MTLAQRLDWLAAGTELLEQNLAALPDSAFAAPSLLPGWTRRHVLAHIGYNARALGRLVHWAHTGEETPMYPDRATRNQEIEDGAKLDPAALRDLVTTSAAALRDAIDALPEPAWSAQVVTAQGRTVPATEIPWLRCREVWVHTVDLDAGTTFSDLPAALLDALIEDITATWQRNRQPPALLVKPTDRTRQWRVDIDGAEPAVLSGTADVVVAALTGRGKAATGPELGRWM